MNSQNGAAAPDLAILSRKQRKNTKLVQKAVGDEAEIHFAALARQRFSMTSGAWIMVALFVGMLASKAIPGFLILFIFRDLVRVPRWIAVAPQGVMVIKRGGLNGKPKQVLSRLAPNLVSLPNANRKLTAGDLEYSLGRKDAATFAQVVVGLRSAATGPDAHAPMERVPSPV